MKYSLNFDEKGNIEGYMAVQDGAEIGDIRFYPEGLSEEEMQKALEDNN